MEFFHTHISPEAFERVKKVLESGRLSEGEQVALFEKLLAEKLGIPNPVTLNSGTTALHLALVLAGVKDGDEVILPAQTFVATGLVILMQGATPVFADIDPLTGNLDPKSVEAKMTSRTKAVMPVHWGGYPCDMTELLAIAKKRGAVVIEDAAHALGATYQKKPIGALSDYTAFSFQAIKHLTTGDGGALSFTGAETAHRAKVLRWFGIDRREAKPTILGEREYDLTEIGYKYHMCDYAAALGVANLGDFPKRLARRQEIGSFYRNELKNVPGLTLLKQENDRTSAYWLFTFLVEKRVEFIKKLQSEGIPSSCVHLRIDHNRLFGGLRNDLPGQAHFNEHQIAIPIHEGLSQDDLQRIVTTIKKGW